jgi:ATP-dependent exoDNAse (exonuclease V) beta subunit
VVDLGDLAKMRSSFQFNRALYVAATRASQHLAIVA